VSFVNARLLPLEVAGSLPIPGCRASRLELEITEAVLSITMRLRLPSLPSLSRD